MNDRLKRAYGSGNKSEIVENKSLAIILIDWMEYNSMWIFFISGQVLFIIEIIDKVYFAELLIFEDSMANLVSSMLMICVLENWS